VSGLCRNGDGRQAFRRGLCRPCYDAVPHQERTPGGKVELGAVDVPPAMVEEIARAALRAGLQVAAWRRRAYEEQLRREARG
jgi:hypothetical protein